MKHFPYTVNYPRTRNWWTSDGDWYQISTWCTQTFGQDNWEYFDQHFVFEQESQKLMFLLRWK